jgi:hypothetical protein
MYRLTLTLDSIESEYTSLPVPMAAGAIRSHFAEMRDSWKSRSDCLALLEQQVQDLRFWFEKLKAVEDNATLKAYMESLEREVLWHLPGQGSAAFSRPKPHPLSLPFTEPQITQAASKARRIAYALGKLSRPS